MIYPTLRAIGLAGIGAPIALLFGVYISEVWPAAALWGVLIGSLVLLDGLLARRALETTIEAPLMLPAGGAPSPLSISFRFAPKAPRGVLDVAIATNGHMATATPSLALPLAEDNQTKAVFTVTARRRGEALVERLWARWKGPMGLAYRQYEKADVARVPVIPDLPGVKERAARLFSRDAAFGLKLQRDRGEGSEYQTLKEFQSGMDPRSVDWKQSARHQLLLAKEYRPERNHPIVLALDTGRLMSEPVAGAPKIDRALNVALLFACVSLKIGDRVGLFAFDARPRLFARPMMGIKSFPALQRLAAKIDYSSEETNFTLGLTTLGGELERRALVVVFTDFVDSTGAELMLENVARLTKRHLVLFVMFRDDELEALVRAEPLTPKDVSRAVVADGLLKERQAVISRLKRMGVETIEAPVDQLGPALIARYLELKQKDRL